MAVTIPHPAEHPEAVKARTKGEAWILNPKHPLRGVARAVLIAMAFSPLLVLAIMVFD
jgi:hypothetical protein